MDEIETVARKKGSQQSTGKNADAYVQFLNVECKIRFRWYVHKESKKTTWCDLTGPEKHRLFSKIDIPRLFPDLHTREQLQKILIGFFKLMKELGEPDCNHTNFGVQSKQCF